MKPLVIALSGMGWWGDGGASNQCATLAYSELLQHIPPYNEYMLIKMEKKKILFGFDFAKLIIFMFIFMRDISL
jgi:hypothetical protein